MNFYLSMCSCRAMFRNRENRRENILRRRILHLLEKIECSAANQTEISRRIISSGAMDTLFELYIEYPVSLMREG